MQIADFCKKLRLKALPAPGWGYVWHSTQPQAGFYTAILDQQPAGTYRFALGHDRWRVALNNKEHQEQGDLHISVEDEMYLDEFAMEIRGMKGPERVGS